MQRRNAMQQRNLPRRQERGQASCAIPACARRPGRRSLTRRASPARFARWIGRTPAPHHATVERSSGMTRRTLQPLAFFAASLALAGGAVAFAATAGPAKGDAAAGKKIFSVKCIACHKADGTGGIKLTGNPTPNWKDPKVWNDPKRATDDYFRDCITNGKAPSGM